MLQLFFFIHKVWCDVLSHYRPKIKCSNYVDLWLYSTDVYFNKYPEYNISCGSYNSSFHIATQRIKNSMSSFLIRNLGLTTTKINSSPQHLLTDVEVYQRHCIFWDNRFEGTVTSGDDGVYITYTFKYTSDRNVIITDYSDSYWFVLTMISIPQGSIFKIHDTSFSFNGHKTLHIYIQTRP